MIISYVYVVSEIDLYIGIVEDDYGVLYKIEY